MTKAITSHFPSASFELLEAAVGPLISDEVNYFEKKKAFFWTRHILFRSNNKPLFARTVTPIQDDITTELITSLGNTPLASLIYTR